MNGKLCPGTSTRTMHRDVRRSWRGVVQTLQAPGRQVTSRRSSVWGSEGRAPGPQMRRCQIGACLHAGPERLPCAHRDHDSRKPVSGSKWGVAGVAGHAVHCRVRGSFAPAFTPNAYLAWAYSRKDGSGRPPVGRGCAPVGVVLCGTTNRRTGRWRSIVCMGAPRMRQAGTSPADQAVRQHDYHVQPSLEMRPPPRPPCALATPGPHHIPTQQENFACNWQ